MLETPILILDADRLAVNAARMLQHCDEKKVFLRPHLKTAKSLEVAKIATNGRMDGITVSTLAEADYFADGGFDDILYAVAITPNKFARVAALGQRTGKSLMLILDSPEMAQAVASSPLNNPVLIEIDCGESRGGLPTDDPALPEIARLLGPQFRGVMTHAGHSYSTDQIDEVQKIAQSEITAAVDAATRLRKLGFGVGIVSVGSTPTVYYGDDFRGISEVRAGIYLFNDLSQYGRNIARYEDLALSVLTTIIGHNRKAGILTVDAGAMALSKDIGANAHLPEARFGWLCDVDTMAHLGLAVDLVHQEHGSVKVSDPALFDRLPIGSLVRVIPNHACLTAAAGYGGFHLTDGRFWPRQDGW
ncbi:MAG: alanine racemase [Rhodobacteraceae bacterium]|nr:alanine racemase [Paracoccaceae bacterium]